MAVAPLAHTTNDGLDAPQCTEIICLHHSAELGKREFFNRAGYGDPCIVH
jgi:hypothetical protein